MIFRTSLQESVATPLLRAYDSAGCFRMYGGMPLNTADRRGASRRWAFQLRLLVVFAAPEKAL